LASDPSPSSYGGGPSAGGPSSGGPGGRPPRGRGRGRYTPRRKVCQFCVDKLDNVDFKDVIRLRRYISERGKIEPRRKTGTCAKHQRKVSQAIKRARQVALLPIAARHIQELGGWFQPAPFLPAPPPSFARQPTPEMSPPVAEAAPPPAEAPPVPAETASPAEG
jgi:small subunit ribosomal protein S18